MPLRRAHASSAWAMVAVAATVLGLMTGCSSSGGSTAGSTTADNGGQSAPSSAGNSSANLGTMRVITSSDHSLNFIGVEGDLDQWSGSGLSVKLISGDSGTVSSALASGTADIGLQAGDTAGLAIAKGLKAKIIGAMILPWNQYLIASTKLGATKPEDLKGKKFGITSFGSGGDYATETMATKLGWSKDDYKLVKIGGGPAGLSAALKSGAIDAFYWSSGTAYQIQEQGYGKIIGSAVGYVGPTAFEVFIASNDIIQNHPDKVKAFMEGYVKAVQEIKSDPTKGDNIMINDWKLEEKASKNAVRDLLPQMDEDGTIPQANLKGLLDSVTFLSKGSVKVTDPSTIYTSWKEIG